MARDYMNFYLTQLTAPLLVGDDTISLGTVPTALAAGDYYRLLVSERDENGNTLKSEWVDLQSDGTVLRAREDSTEEAFEIGDWVEIAESAESYRRIDGAQIIEKTSSVTDPAISVSKGSWQGFNVTENVTMSFADLPIGGSVTLDFTGALATYVVSWPTGLWKDGSGPPDISAATMARFFIEKNINGQYLFTHFGNYA